MSAERDTAMRAFLKSAGWGNALVTPLPGDASTRHYFRIAHGSRKAMLMDQPQQAETPVAAAHATPDERRALGYNAVARLAGGDVARFVAAANYLRARGLSAPDIYADDPAQGFALLEDLGDSLYFDTLATGRADEHEIYLAAADVLARLHEEDAPALLSPGKPFHAYDETAQLAEVDLLLEWFVPLALGRQATPQEAADYRALWKNALDATRSHAPVFVHRDYHAQNLLWLPERDGIARVGLLDFQDAVAGSRAQDLMHLVEDARRDVSPDVAAATVRHYRDLAKARDEAFDDKQFGAEMATMAAQRNARIVGIFARLYKRDGKPRYLEYLPRVWGYLNRDLEHPALAPLKAWYDRTIPMEARGRPRGI
jgi:aminoglycoside/choline kinase family phosphotransferase